LVLLVNDSEYNNFTGQKLIQCRCGIYLVSPGALRAADKRTNAAGRATITLFAEGRTLTLEEFKYAFESWRQTPVIAGNAFCNFPIVMRDEGSKVGKDLTNQQLNQGKYY